jgi:GGDEF domain-containing protein
MSTDFLTPQTFMETLEQERARVHRNGRPFSLVLFRLTEADGAQEAVPADLLSAMAKRVRAIDRLGRYDQEHIGLLLPHTAAEGARKISDELFRVPSIASHISACQVFAYP